MRKYSDEVKQFIAAKVEGTTTRDLVELVNSTFDLDITENQMKAYKSNHGLKSNTRVGIAPGQPTKRYPREVMEFITDNLAGTGPKEMASLLNSTFGTNYTFGQIKSYYTNRRLNSGLDGRFKPGNVPFNKGRKGITQGGVETQFKKGNRPHNYMPVGSERVNGDGYVDIKTADPNKWRGKHLIIYEQYHGPIPKGHVVIFGDGDKSNFDLDNLILVSRAQLAMLNKQRMIQNDADLTRVAVGIVNLQQQIREREK